MQIVNIHEAKTHLSRFVDEAARGREIVIARAGKPVARLVPLMPAPKKKRFGLLKGRIRIPAGFDAPLPDDVLESFEGGSR
jgi:prevent-host-death family protein